MRDLTVMTMMIIITSDKGGVSMTSLIMTIRQMHGVGDHSRSKIDFVIVHRACTIIVHKKPINVLRA